MRYLWGMLCFACALGSAQAVEPWGFSARIALGAAPGESVYHHLDGAGRKHIAVSGEAVAVVWEDNRSGSPQVYAAQKSLAAESFSAAVLASSGGEAYEPSILGLAGERFMLAYEQDGVVYARVLGATGLGGELKLSGRQASHASLAGFGDTVYASWRERVDGEWFVKVAVLETGEDNRPRVVSLQSIEKDGLPTPVLFPSIAANAAGACIAWEDRREGHTRLLVSSTRSIATGFGEPQELNEYLSNRTEYDRGNGVTRVSLASFGRDEVLAAWMDKRRGGSGYGIFASLGAEGGGYFGPNEKVHGEQGDRQPHYNPATAGNIAGDFVVAWDDFRRGDSDVWISHYDSDLEWSEDYSPEIAGGKGEQSHPSIAIDKQRNLHLLWIERASLNGPTRLWYSTSPLPSL